MTKSSVIEASQLSNDLSPYFPGFWCNTSVLDEDPPRLLRLRSSLAVDRADWNGWLLSRAFFFSSRATLWYTSSRSRSGWGPSCSRSPTGSLWLLAVSTQGPFGCSSKTPHSCWTLSDEKAPPARGGNRSTLIDMCWDWWRNTRTSGGKLHRCRWWQVLGGGWVFNCLELNNTLMWMSLFASVNRDSLARSLSLSLSLSV